MAAGIIENTPADAPDYGKRSRGWVFTVNNYTDDDKARLFTMADEATYLIAGLEVGKKTGTPHIQGYVHFANARTYESLRKKVPQGWFKKAKGTGVQNKVYCSKQGEVFLEKGTPPVQGARSDLEEVYDMLREGATMRLVLDTEPSLQQIQVAEKFLKYKEAPRTAAAEIRWYAGPPGAGKSYAARQWLGDDTHVASRTTSKFWDGYDAHKGVLIDDFRPKWCDFVELLGILDEGPYAVEVKGSSRQLKATKIAITCPYTPQELYSAHNENIEQLLGRISVVIKVDGSVRSRPPPRYCTLGPNGELIDIIDPKGKDATGGQKGDCQRPVSAQAGNSPGHAFKNFNPGNNLGVPVTPDNGSEPSRSRSRKTKEERYKERCLPIWSYAGQDRGSEEGIAFPQTPSLCSSQSDYADGVYQQEYDATPDDPGSEDSAFDEGEP